MSGALGERVLLRQLHVRPRFLQGRKLAIEKRPRSVHRLGEVSPIRPPRSPPTTPFALSSRAPRPTCSLKHQTRHEFIRADVGSKHRVYEPGSNASDSMASPTLAPHSPCLRSARAISLARCNSRISLDIILNLAETSPASTPSPPTSPARLHRFSELHQVFALSRVFIDRSSLHVRERALHLPRASIETLEIVVRVLVDVAREERTNRFVISIPHQ